MYWYSSPALLKQWEDDVLEYGWAYGSKGDALHGKELVIAVSPGEDNYDWDKFAKYHVTELLRPFQATSRLIGTKFVKPFITVGSFDDWKRITGTTSPCIHNLSNPGDVTSTG